MPGSAQGASGLDAVDTGAQAHVEEAVLESHQGKRGGAVDADL